MAVTVSGPMFDPAEDQYRQASRCMSCGHRDGGGHYNIFATRDPDAALAMLRAWFPDGKANEMNFVLFSTSGVHGMYTTIEDEWASIGKRDDDAEPDGEIKQHGEVTFLLVQPRIVGMTYGNVRIRTAEDVSFLKRLRASSWRVVPTIGRPERKP